MMTIRGTAAVLALALASVAFGDGLTAPPAAPADQAKPAAVPEAPARDNLPAPGAASGGVPPALELLAYPEETARKYPTVVVGGSLQADAGWFVQDAANIALFGPIADGAAFRRARLHAIGSVADNVDYRLQMDFAFFGRPTFTDLYADIRDVPRLGTVRFGQWKQFFGLEEITSFRFNPFMERASIFVLQPFRRMGIGFFDHSQDERFTWGASFVAAGQDQFGGSLAVVGGEGMTARVSFNPVYEEDGRRLLHLGTAYYLAHPNNNLLRFGAFGGNTPGFGLFTGTIGTPLFASPPNTPSFVDTGLMAAYLQNLWGTEFAWVRGPLSVQSEVNLTLVNRVAAAPNFFWGGYVFVTLFLTGEHRTYSRKHGTFDRVMPHEPFEPRKYGRLLGGAWEIGYRLAFLDLANGDIAGGQLLDHTLALNWYLNGYTKISFNYINARLWRGIAQPSDSHVFALRGQIDF